MTYQLINIKKKVDKAELEEKIKFVYENVAEKPKGNYHFELGYNLAVRLGYPKQNLEKIPIGSIERFAGVGYHFDIAKIRPGEKVLDLGSGSGMDLIYSALEVGPSGEAVGVDMTTAQLVKSKKIVEENNIKNVKLVESYIEELPFDDNKFDVVISNGVINLSAEKEKVFKEIFRVLKPGGRLAFSDIISEKHMPESIVCDATLWASCIGGATQIDTLFEITEKIGFLAILQKNNDYSFLSKSAKGASNTYGVKSNSFLFKKPE